MDSLPSDVCLIIYRYIHRYKLFNVNRLHNCKTSYIKLIFDQIYTIGLPSQVNVSSTEHQYRRCIGCGRWLIASRLTDSIQKLTKCGGCYI